MPWGSVNWKGALLKTQLVENTGAQSFRLVEATISQLVMGVEMKVSGRV